MYNKLIEIGKITSPVGLKGEVKIISYSDEPDRFEYLEGVFVKERGEAEPVFREIEGVRYKGPSIILKLEGIDNRNASEAVRACDIFIDEDDLPELEEGRYYVRDIIGLEVRTEEGTLLGKLKDVQTNTAQDLYVVKREEGSAGGNRDLLVPGVPEFIRKVDVEMGVITVRLPDGLLEL